MLRTLWIEMQYNRTYPFLVSTAVQYSKFPTHDCIPVEGVQKEQNKLEEKQKQRKERKAERGQGKGEKRVETREERGKREKENGEMGEEER